MKRQCPALKRLTYRSRGWHGRGIGVLRAVTEIYRVLGILGEWASYPVPGEGEGGSQVSFLEDAVSERIQIKEIDIRGHCSSLR